MANKIVFPAMVRDIGTSKIVTIPSFFIKTKQVVTGKTYEFTVKELKGVSIEEEEPDYEVTKNEVEPKKDNTAQSIMDELSKMS